MRKVYLNMKQDYKYNIIKDCSNQRISKYGAALKLGISIRQVNRLLKAYHLEGKEAFIHGNSKCVPHNKIDDSTASLIVSLYTTKYEGSNVVFFSELLSEYEQLDVSSTFVRQLLHSKLIFPPRTRKKQRTHN